MTDNEIIKALECNPLDDIGGCRKIDALSLIKSQKAEIERLNGVSEICGECHKKYAKKTETAKSEAVKEFAERLKEKSKMPLGTLYGKLVYLTDIDNLVKEMTEDEGE